jgi:hypothetical protein
MPACIEGNNMSRNMMSFDRFAHGGVLQDLRRLKRRLEEAGGYEFGSSGDGEMTVRCPLVTAYARKYRNRDGWRLGNYHGSKVLEELKLESESQVFEAILKASK